MTLRAGIIAAALLLVPRTDAAAQQLVVLRIKVTILDADQHPRPVPRHALLISDNPATGTPRRTVTALDGTAELRVRPGNYTVESDQPLIFQDQAYEWTQTLDVPAGHDTLLELTAGNARVEAAPAAASAEASATARDEARTSGLLLDWQNSVVSIWSQTGHGAGFLIDARGLIATNQHLVGNSTSVEIQLSPSLKLAARVLVSDATKDVAILWIDSKAVGSARPVKLAYAPADKATVAEKDGVFAISTPMRDQKTLTSGHVSRVNVHTLLSDVQLDEDSLGAPLFNAAGEVVAISTPGDDQSSASSGVYRAIRIDEARAVIAEAERKMQSGPAPSGAALPLEPERPFEDEALREATKGRAGSVAAYLVSGADFDVSLITPVLLYAARHQGDREGVRERERGGRDPREMSSAMRAVTDFGSWSSYVAEYPPVLLIRATPKMVESFWTTVGRAAASTQGMQLPAFKHVKAGFSRLRAFCGDAEVTPIHPFKIEQRLDGTNVMYEGLYVFDPAALGPQCGTVKLMLYSEKDPDRPDTKIVDAKVVQQIWVDFAPYRAAEPR